MERTTLMLLLMAAYSLLSGVFDQAMYPGQPFPPTAIAHSLATLLLVFLWYRADMRRWNAAPSRWLDLGVILIAIIAIPAHLFRSRGWKRGALATLIALLWLIVLGVLSEGGRWTTYLVFQS